jgi:hypothetical protein
VIVLATKPWAFVEDEIAGMNVPAVFAVLAEDADLETEPHKAGAAIAYCKR